MELTRTRLYRDGGWQPAHSSRTLTVTNPSTELPLGQAPWSDERDVDAAVRSARRAFDEGPWRRGGAADRSAAMRRLADEIEARADSFASVVAREVGQPLAFARARNATSPAAMLRYYAEVLDGRDEEEQRPARSWRGSTVVRREPVGVAGLIVPWNYPQALTMSKLAPALAAGCTVVLKPAAETPFDAYLLAEACHAAGLPDGVVNLLPGGRDTGEHLVRHPGVDMIAFTGSTAAGRAIATACGELLRPVSLELGGKSAAIVLPDADLDAVLGHLARLSFANSGQTCFMLSRILAPRSRYGDVVAALEALAGGFVLGDPFDPSTTMGPLVSAAQHDRVGGLVARSIEEGARLVTGGRRPAELDRGYFYEPTVLADTDNGAAVNRAEIFGPVVAVIPFDDEAEAVAIANDSEYGLGGAVFTADRERGIALARRIQTGTIGVNGYGPDVTAPFGGYKASGLGREHGPEAIDSFENIKSIYLPDPTG